MTPSQKTASDLEMDIQRFRNAYTRQMRLDPDHEVALAMIGADLARATRRALEHNRSSAFKAVVAMAEED